MIKGLELDILGDSNFSPVSLFSVTGISPYWDCLKKKYVGWLKVVKPTQTLPFIGFG
jgi:hypothetical protein